MSESEDIMSSSASVHTYPESTSSEHYSRSSQQVPRITEISNGYITEGSQYSFNNSKPYLNITEQPLDTFRFRYKSEMVGTHGCLLGSGKSQKSREKTHPGVELINYNGRAKIRCSLAQVNVDKSPHPHRLLVDERDEDVIQEVDAHKGYRVVFSGMSIIHTAKKFVADELYHRRKSKLTVEEQEKWRTEDEYHLKKDCEEKAKSINLNQVCLCFSAYSIEDSKAICPPVYSTAINNLKSAMTNELKIARISKVKGKCIGGDDVFIFVEKVTKKNIKIRFYESDDNITLWEAYGAFTLSDVHHQYGIVFQTPPYRDLKLSKSKDVWVELVRPSDGKVSEAVKFTYQADPSAALAPGKRRRAEVSTSLSSLGSSGGSSSMDLPTSVLSQDIERVSMDTRQSILNESSGIQTLLSKMNTGHNQKSSHTDVLGDVLMQRFETPQDTLLSSSAILLNKTLYSDVTPSDVAMSGELNSSAILGHVLDGGVDSAEYKKFLENCTESYMEIFNAEDTPCTLQTDGVGVQRIGTTIEEHKPDISPSKLKDPSTNIEMCEMSEPEVKLEEDSCSEGEDEGEYTATYNAADGQRVQRLVSELEGLLTSTCHKSSIVGKVKELMDIKLSNGDSFIHMSIQNDILETVTFVVKLLIKLDLRETLNAQNICGDTVLHSAVLCDHPKIIPLLVQAGCNPNIEDTDGNTPLHHAITYARKDCLDKLLAADKTNLIIDNKINFNAINSDGHCALHLCAMTGDVLSAAALLARGANVNVADPAGRTALHLAVKAALQDEAKISKSYKVVVILLQSKVEIDAVDRDGNTALRIACRDNEAYDIIKLLLEKGADPMKALHITEDVNQDDDDDVTQDDDDDEVSQDHMSNATYTRTLVNVLNDMGKMEIANRLFKKYFKG